MGGDRVVVVTGGASGIGLGVCRRFAADGHPVAMLDTQDEALAREGAAIRAAGGTVLTLRVDVSSRAEIDAAYAEVREQLGPIAIVIANAGISKARLFPDITGDEWDRTIAVNLTGVFNTIQAAVPDMIAAGWGRIVTISSNAAQQGAADRAHYAASKGGVIALTKALGRELAAHGITANTIPPALVDTPLARAGEAAGEVPPIAAIAGFIPLKRAGTPEDIAGACAFLASDDAAYVTGIELNVNGGLYI